MKNTFVSVVIPCRNEEKFIGRCLESFIANDYPKDRMEVLVVNGASEDGTRSIVADYAARYPFIKLLENPKKITPISMNVGITNARGDVVILAGAHADYQKDYISKSVRYLEEYGADNVGGALRTLPAEHTRTARAIAYALSSFFGTGGATFRVGSEKPRFVDTVFGGCFRKEVFKKIGLINERLVRSQDMEFSVRLKRAGGKILLAPDIVVTYYPKPTFGSFWKHNVQDGIWAILPLKFGAPLFKPRHLLPLLFVLGVAVSAIAGIFFRPLLLVAGGVLLLYLLAAMFFSLAIALEKKDMPLVPFLLAAFAVRHFGYGIGSVAGVLKLMV